MAKSLKYIKLFEKAIFTNPSVEDQFGKVQKAYNKGSKESFPISEKDGDEFQAKAQKYFLYEAPDKEEKYYLYNGQSFWLAKMNTSKEYLLGIMDLTLAE